MVGASSLIKTMDSRVDAKMVSLEVAVKWKM